MTFYDAMKAVADGKTVKRHAWAGKALCLRLGTVWELWRGALLGEYAINARDLNATDWEIMG